MIDRFHGVSIFFYQHLLLFLFFYLDYEFHATTREVEEKISEIEVYYSAEVVPSKGGGVVHEEEGYYYCEEAQEYPAEPAANYGFFNIWEVLV